LRKGTPVAVILQQEVQTVEKPSHSPNGSQAVRVFNQTRGVYVGFAIIFRSRAQRAEEMMTLPGRPENPQFFRRRPPTFAPSSTNPVCR
jgi:hypothetical protein